MGAKNDLRRMLTRRARIDPHPGGPAGAITSES